MGFFRSFFVSLVGASFILSQAPFALAEDAAPNATWVPPSPEPLPGEADVGEAISPMRRGQLAPFTGVLLSPKAIARVTIDLESLDKRVVIEVGRARAEEQAKCQHALDGMTIRHEADAEVWSAQMESNDSQIDVLSERLKKEEESASDPLLWGALGFGAGLGMALLTVIAVSKSTE